jgi:Na+-driven multidrug efflux pump
LLFALQPIIALSVAMLPYAARRFGERDLEGVRRGLADAVRVTGIFSLAVVGPLMLWIAPWVADQLAESVITTRYATFALRLVPLSCFSGALFLLARPVFEAMNQGRPGLVMAILRYLVLTGPLAWLGLRAAASAGYPPLYGLMLGLLGAAAISSLAFYGWLRRALLHAVSTADR